MSKIKTELKVPYYTVFHQFHTAVRGPTTLYLKYIAPNPSMVLNFSCLKVAQVSSTESSLFLCLHPEMLMSSVCLRLPCLLHVHLRERLPFTLVVACANVYVDVSLWLAKMLLFNHTSLTQNLTQIVEQITEKLCKL